VGGIPNYLGPHLLLVDFQPVSAHYHYQHTFYESSAIDIIKLSVELDL